MSRRIDHEKKNRRNLVSRNLSIEYQQKARIDPGGPWQPLETISQYDKAINSLQRRRLLTLDKEQLLRSLSNWCAGLDNKSPRQRESVRKYIVNDVRALLIKLPRTRYSPSERHRIEEAATRFGVEISPPWKRARKIGSSRTDVLTAGRKIRALSPPAVQQDVGRHSRRK